MTISNPLAVKRDALLAITLDDQSLTNAMEILSSNYPQVDLASDSEQLLRILEREREQSHASFLEAYDRFIEDWSMIKVGLDDLSMHCEQLEQKWEVTFESFSGFVANVEQVQKEIAVLDDQNEAIKGFLKRFTLSEEEAQVITSHEPLNRAFFAAYTRLQRIQIECETSLNPAEFKCYEDILNYLSDYQEAAHTKLMRGTQAEYRNWFPEAPEVTPALRGAMRMLEYRPTLFQVCIEDISAARRDHLLAAFKMAMTGGSRPIELVAHDIQRYTGDILAWLHQTIISERELWEAVFNLDGDGPDYIPDLSDVTSPLSINENVKLLVDLDISEVLEPLRVRVEEVFQARPGVIEEYKLAQLLLFYSLTVNKTLGMDKNVSALLDTLVTEAFDIFTKSLQDQAEHLLRCPEPPEANLLPCQAVIKMNQQIIEIVKAYASSMVSESERNADDFRRPGFDSVLGRMVGPLIQMCDIGSTFLTERDRAIYLINCLHTLQEALGQSSGTSSRKQALETAAEAYLHILIQNQFDELLIQSGLFEIAKQVEASDTKLTLSENPNATPESVAMALANLDSFLLMMNFEIPDWLKPLTDSKLAKEIFKRGMDEFIKVYRRIRKCLVQDPGYEDLWRNGTIIRTVEELETLLILD